ncbi:hypothetical protein [Streptomyces cavernicola]|uniref:Uncharacterized protein n=1 Tax=Streptomyces cavernicola TaxID=3043613 RepID=A0ABT6S701_9ACTN|nr:hypothetical protein [Streptomyces sp. B-S-A6]MDI3403859.1 hypothetical protein [Streptomyces sp. B-S-A6]
MSLIPTLAPLRRRFLLPALAAVSLFTAVVPAADAAQAHQAGLHCPQSACGSISVGTPSLAPPAQEGEACTSKEQVVCRIREMTPAERFQAREVRVRYHGLLTDMGRRRCELEQAGANPETVARELVRMRNEAKDIARAGMTPAEVAALEERNLKKYGNPLGPTADQLYAKYGSWEQVVESAGRTSAAVDGELGLAYKACPCEYAHAA